MWVIAGNGQVPYTCEKESFHGISSLHSLLKSVEDFVGGIDVEFLTKLCHASEMPGDRLGGALQLSCDLLYRNRAYTGSIKKLISSFQYHLFCDRSFSSHDPLII